MRKPVLCLSIGTCLTLVFIVLEKKWHESLIIHWQKVLFLSDGTGLEWNKWLKEFGLESKIKNIECTILNSFI